MNDTHIHFHDCPYHAEIAGRLDRVEALLRRLVKEERMVSTEVQALVTEVTEIKDVQQAAKRAILGGLEHLEEVIATQGEDKTAIAKAVADLKESASDLAVAIPANTEPSPPVVEPAPDGSTSAEPGTETPPLNV